MSWVEKNWKPLTVVGGLLGLSWFAGKRFEGAETFDAERIKYDFIVHREPKGKKIGKDGKRIPNPKGGWFKSVKDAETFEANEICYRSCYEHEWRLSGTPHLGDYTPDGTPILNWRCDACGQSKSSPTEPSSKGDTHDWRLTKTKNWEDGVFTVYAQCERCGVKGYADGDVEESIDSVHPSLRAETFEAPYGRMPAWRRGKRQWNKNHLVWASDSKAVREAIKTAFPEQKFSVRIVNGEYIEVVAKSGTRPADIEQFREDVKSVAMEALGEIYKDSPEELREKSVYVYASPRDFGAESFEAYDPMMQNRIDRNECSHSYDDGDSRGGDAWVLKYADLMGVEDGMSYIEAGVKCGICGQERIGSWGINEREGFQITKGEEGRMPRFYGFYGAEPNERSE